MIGGLLGALTGQTRARVVAPRMNTKAGTAAIQGQMQRASQNAVNQGYSLAAGARGSSSPLALREAQRRGSMAQGDIAQQTGILQKQLEQGAAQQNAQLQMQANQQNAAIRQANDQALGKFVQGAAGAMAGGMISDVRAKEAAYLAGRQDAGGFDAGGDFGDPVLNAEALRAGTSPHSNAAATTGGGIGSGMSFEERQQVAAHLNRRGEDNTMQQHARQVYGADAERAVPEAFSPQAAPAPMQYAPQAPAPVAAPQQAKPNPFQWLIDSDKRAKDLERENGALKAALVRDEADAAAYGREWTKRNNAAVFQDVAAQSAFNQRMNAEQAALANANRDRNQYMATAQAMQAAQQPAAMQAPPPPMGPPLPQRPVTSDEDSKEGMEFPDGIRPVAFKYKDGIEGTPGAPPGRHVGVLAQDLEKTPEGETVVTEDPQTGMKQVDTAQLSLLLTAKLAEMDKKLDALSGKKRKAKKADD